VGKKVSSLKCGRERNHNFDSKKQEWYMHACIFLNKLKVGIGFGLKTFDCVLCSRCRKFKIAPLGSMCLSLHTYMQATLAMQTKDKCC
jgi:hypothetical protein